MRCPSSKLLLYEISSNGTTFKLTLLFSVCLAGLILKNARIIRTLEFQLGIQKQHLLPHIWLLRSAQ